MRPKHEKYEKPFYENAYADPKTRLERGFGWDVKPSPSMAELFEQYVQPTIAHQESVRVLDIGIGADGRNARYFLEHGFTVVGVDISTNAITYCAETVGMKYPTQLTLIEKDMSMKGAAVELGRFDIVVDWSVMDHIRRAYLPSYKRNILRTMKPGGFLFTSQFATPLPEKFRPQKGRDFHLWQGHYMRAFHVEELKAEFPTLQVIDQRELCPEDQVNGIKIHTVLFRKEA